MEFEISILNWLQTLHTPFLDQFMIVVSTIGNGGMVWIIIALVLLLNKNWRKYGVMMGNKTVTTNLNKTIRICIEV